MVGGWQSSGVHQRAQRSVGRRLSRPGAVYDRRRRVVPTWLTNDTRSVGQPDWSPAGRDGSRDLRRRWAQARARAGTGPALRRRALARPAVRSRTVEAHHYNRAFRAGGSRTSIVLASSRAHARRSFASTTRAPASRVATSCSRRAWAKDFRQGRPRDHGPGRGRPRHRLHRALVRLRPAGERTGARPRAPGRVAAAPHRRRPVRAGRASTRASADLAGLLPRHTYLLAAGSLGRIRKSTVDRGIALGLALVIGGLIAAQPATNALLSRHTGALAAALTSLLVSAAIIAVLLVAAGDVGRLASLSEFRPVHLIGGIAGAAVVGGLIALIGPLGATVLDGRAGDHSARGFRGTRLGRVSRRGQGAVQRDQRRGHPLPRRRHRLRPPRGRSSPRRTGNRPGGRRRATAGAAASRPSSRRPPRKDVLTCPPSTGRSRSCAIRRPPCSCSTSRWSTPRCPTSLPT